MTKLSIITINYNNASGLLKTIESVINQTNKNFEYIIIDGASTDNSLEIIKNNSSFITKFISENDDGVYNALNKGIKNATGKYLIFMNSGDVFFDETVTETFLNATISSKDIYYGDAFYYTTEGYNRLEKNPENLDFWYLKTFGINHQATFFNKNLFNIIGFYNENYKICSDWEFLLKSIILHRATYQKIDKTICKYDFSGISANPKNHQLYLDEKEKIIQEWFPALANDSKLLDEIHSKRFQQVIRIKNSPLAWKIFKSLLTVFILFLPKNKKINA